jgi:hypothetical protein
MTAFNYDQKEVVSGPDRRGTIWARIVVEDTTDNGNKREIKRGNTAGYASGYTGRK